MARYKDVDKILEAMDTWPKYGCKPDGRFFKLTKETETDFVPYVHYDDMVQAVTGTPVQDVAPVVHAHWIEDGDDDICSNCNEIVFPCISGLQMDKALKEGRTYWNYCPHCGAKMDEKGNK